MNAQFFKLGFALAFAKLGQGPSIEQMKQQAYNEYAAQKGGYTAQPMRQQQQVAPVQRQQQQVAPVQPAQQASMAAPSALSAGAQTVQAPQAAPAQNKGPSPYGSAQYEKGWGQGGSVQRNRAALRRLL